MFCDEEIVNVVISDIQTSSNPSAKIDEIRLSFRQSDQMREVGPLLIRNLCNMWLSSESDIKCSIAELFNEISIASRQHEAYTFFVEAWVDFKNAQLRSVILTCFSNILSKAQKGPIAKKKTHFVVQVCSLILNDYFLTDKSSEESVCMIEASMTLLKGLTFEQNNVFSEEMRINDMASLCLNDTLATLLLRITRFISYKLTSDHTHKKCCDSSVVSNERSNYLKSVRSQLIALSSGMSDVMNLVYRRCKSLKLCDGHQAAIDLQDLDLGWWISSVSDTKSFPWVLTSESRFDLLIKSSCLHAKTNQAPQAVTDFVAAFELSSQSLQLNDSLSSTMYHLIELAVSAPPSFGPLASPVGLSGEQRQTIFAVYKGLTQKINFPDIVEITLEFVSDSRQDSAVALFLKVAKDRWADEKSEKSLETFFKICKNIFSSEFSILDGIDSLITLMNWLRLVALREPELTMNHKEFFSTQLAIQARKVDAELSALKTRNTEVSALQETRVIMYADLIKRVKEICGL